MGFLDSLVSFLRHPVDFVQHAVCESNAQSQSCNTLTALAQSMGGDSPQRLAAISTYQSQPLPQVPAPQTLTGCFFHSIVLPARDLETLRQQLRHTPPAQARPDTVVGCYIQHMSSPDPVAMRAELQRAVARANRVPTTPRPLPAVRETPVGCYIEHQIQTGGPLQPDAGVAPTRHRH